MMTTKQMETKYASFEGKNVNNAVLKKVKNEIGETELRKEQTLNEVKEKLKEVPDLEPDLDDTFLMRFVRLSKHDSSKALQRLLQYYNHQEKLLPMYDRCQLHASQLEDEGSRFLWASPYRTVNLSSLFVVYMGTMAYTDIAFEDRLCLDLVVFHAMCKSPLNQICGVTFLLDFQGFSQMALLQYSVKTVKRFVDILQNIMAERVKGIHMVNMNYLCILLVKIAMRFASEKIKSRITLHRMKDGWQNLHDYIPADILPEQYGGKLPQGRMINLLENIEDMEREFCEHLRFGFAKSKARRQNIKLVLYQNYGHTVTQTESVE